MSVLRWNAHRLTAATLRDKIKALGSGAAGVTVLDLGQNDLAALPDEIASMTALERLNLQQNKLQRLPVLPMPNLRLLNASFNELREWPVWVAQECQALERLALADNRLAVPVGDAEWSNLTKLEFLSLERNPLPGTLAKFFDGKPIAQAALQLLENHNKGRFRDVPMAAAKK